MDLSSYTAGSYEQQFEYSSFRPSLVDQPWMVDDAELVDLLGRADRSLGELNAYSQLVPDINFFLRMYVAKEATQSSRIEGTQTNIEDAFKDAEDLLVDERDDWSEVQNYIAAVNHAIDRLDTLPLSNRLLRETHAILLAGVRGERKTPGEFRVSQNWIGVSLENAVFVPPHQDYVPELMGDLEKLLNNQQTFVPPLIRIGIGHYQFETIHPFQDGNGRLGRLMIALYLAQTGLLKVPALYLSDYFEKNKTDYVDHLMAVRQGNHMKAWLVFFLHGIEQTAKSAALRFKEILELKEKIEREVLPTFGTRRLDPARLLVQYLYERPVIDIKAAASLLESSPATASAMINDLVKHGVLEETTGFTRNRLFAFRKYIRLFDR